MNGQIYLKWEMPGIKNSATLEKKSNVNIIITVSDSYK